MELQYRRGRPAKSIREPPAQAPHLCARNYRASADRPDAAYPDAGSVLAQHQLERALISPQAEPLLVVVLGPTASGKTALAVALAERFGGEIVNCDSAAMYREFEIGTAKPSPAERARAPHYLLDFVAPSAYITAGEYARQAREVIRDISARGKLPIVAGGTGLYLRALLEGLFSGPHRWEALRERLRARAEQRGSSYLHRILRRLDAAAADRIHANDSPKLIRAIEVCLGSGRKMSQLWQEGRDPLRGFRILRLGLKPDREALYDRINQRAKQMFDSGLLEETRGLVQKYGQDAGPLSWLGYKEAMQLLNGRVELEQAISAAQQAHRNYAKRQLTWFRREPEVVWLAGFGDQPAILEEAVKVVSAALVVV